MNYYYDKYYIEAINILDNDISSNVEKVKIKKNNPFYEHNSYVSENQFFEVEGMKINYKIPFNGNIDLLYLIPPMRILTKFEIDGIENKNSDEFLPTILFSINIESDILEKEGNPKEFIDQQFSKEFKNYQAMINNVNVNIENYNKSLKTNITTLLNIRKKKSSNFSNLLSKINIPLKASNNSNTTPISLKIKKKNAKYPDKKNSYQEFCIEENDYINIKNIIEQQCISFEKGARTFNKLEEEELRDVILSNLNTHYNSLATGETFSKNGKTDIRIQFDNKAAYIAECKIWHGISEFSDAISQLFSYITWRDVKTSLIIFNKENKDFNSILTKVNDYLKTYELCVTRSNIKKNIWDCSIRKNSESEEIISLNIIICDISI